jgi:hypothetical protein
MSQSSGTPRKRNCERKKDEETIDAEVKDIVGKSQDSYWLRKYVRLNRPTHEICSSTHEIGQKTDSLRSTIDTNLKFSVCVAFLSY